jgi:hypothetical protein
LLGPRYRRKQILELVLSLLARLLRDLGALNLVVNFVLAGSSVSAVHCQKSIVKSFASTKLIIKPA